MMRARILFCSAVLLSALACTDQSPVIGVVNGALPLRGAALALEDARAGGFDLPIDTVLVPEVSAQLTTAVSAALGLVSTPGLVAVLGHSNSPGSLAAAPIYNKAEVVQISPQASADLYSEAGPYSFRMVPPDVRQGRRLAEHLATRYPGSRIALAYVNDDYGKGLRDAVLNALPDGAVEIVLDEPHVEFANDDMVHRSVLSIVDARPDVILWLSRAWQLRNYLPGIRQELGAIPIVGGDGLVPGASYPDPDGLWSNTYYFRFVDLDGNPAIRRFRERFQQRFGLEADGAAVLAYDGMSVLLEAVRSGAGTGTEIREYLQSLGRLRPAFQGVAGPVMFDAKGNVARDYHLDSIPAP